MTITGHHIAITPKGSGWHCDTCGRLLANKEKCLFTLHIERPGTYSTVIECFRCIDEQAEQPNDRDDLTHDEKGVAYVPGAVKVWR